MQLDDKECPSCHDNMQTRSEPGSQNPRASTYDDCLRQCPTCGIAYSNAGSNPILIYKDYCENVPCHVRQGLPNILNKAANVTNRKSKTVKFWSGNSEDAVTWTVFKYLMDSQRLSTIAPLVGLKFCPSPKPNLYLWGVDVLTEVPYQLWCDTCKKIGEKQQSYSEPDVIIDFGDAGMVIIEAKYRSDNHTLCETDKRWKKYNFPGDFTDFLGIKKTGLYELARNWRIGCDLAGSRPFRLVNLGPKDLFTDESISNLVAFHNCLNLGNHREFEILTWSSILQGLGALPPWLFQYARERDLF